MHTLTPEQRSAIVAELERSQKALLDAGRGLSPEQWTWKPSPESWSIGECLEHVAIVEQLFQQRLQRMSAAVPGEDIAGRVAGREAQTVTAGRSRETKRKAPPAAVPTGAFATFEAFEAHFTPLREQSLTFVRTTEAPLHGVSEVHGALGELSGHQWLCLLAAHSERHAEQAREVREQPKFPPSDVAS